MTSLSVYFINAVYTVYLSVMAILLIFCLILAVKGPRFTDRIVCINVIGTLSTAIICVLSIVIDEGYLSDIALVYSPLNFLAVVILSHVVTVQYRKTHINKNESSSDTEVKQ